jgi:UDP-2,3-diacylglucosamine hydrolase
MTGSNDEKFLGEEKEWLVVYTKDKLKEEHFDFFVFGHRHLPIDFQLNEQSRYINLGDWIKYNSYAEFDGEQLLLKYHQ